MITDQMVECALRAWADAPLDPTVAMRAALSAVEGAGVVEALERAAKVADDVVEDLKEVFVETGYDTALSDSGREGIKDRLSASIRTAAAIAEAIRAVPPTPSNMRAALTAAELAWKEIGTAPRDGTICDLWLKGGGRVADQWWDADDQSWCGLDEGLFSHWMQAPSVPSNQEHAAPEGYHRLPKGQQCKCVRCWKAEDGLFWCCLPEPKWGEAR